MFTRVSTTSARVPSLVKSVVVVRGSVTTLGILYRLNNRQKLRHIPRRHRRHCGLSSKEIVLRGCAVLICVMGAGAWAHGQAPTPPSGEEEFDTPTLADAQHLFYSGRYDAAAALALTLRSTREFEPLSAYELRTSALLFQIKATLGNQRDRDEAFK